VEAVRRMIISVFWSRFLPHLTKVMLVPALLALALAGCGGSGEQTAAPPVPVRIITIKPQPIPNIVELPGRIESVRMAEVRARTDGIVLRRLYEEGAFVKEGAPLFSIDPRDYRAQVQAAEASLQRARAARENAASIVARYTPLMAERAVSAQEFDAARASLQQAEAQVSEAQAALARARLSESYTTVRAPISGIAGKAEVTEGALVSGGQATLMTRIDNTGPVYAVFAVSHASVLDTIKQQRSGALTLNSLDSIEVKLILDNGDTYGPVGRVNFSSPVVDPSTGSQSLRATFANPDGLLRSGEFVRGRLAVGEVTKGISVPARAVQIKSDYANVSVLDAENQVSVRKITLGEQVGSNWTVQTGLKAGDRVIVEGWQKARPGQKVQVMPEAGAKPAASAR